MISTPPDSSIKLPCLLVPPRRKENRATGRTLPDRASSSLQISLRTPERAEQEDLSLSKKTHARRDQRERAQRAPVHGSPGPAVGRHGGRAAPGLRPRQAPQVRLLLALFILLLGARGRGRAAGGGWGERRRARASRDAQHHHAPPLGAVRRHVAAQRVQLRAVVAGQRRPGLALRCSHDAEGRGLEEAAPERQDGRRRRRRRPRHAEEPHRLRLGGDQLA